MKVKVSNKKCKPIVCVDKDLGVRNVLYDMTSFQEADYDEKLEEWKKALVKRKNAFKTTKTKELSKPEKVADIMNTAIARIGGISDNNEAQEYCENNVDVLDDPIKFILLLRTVKNEKYRMEEFCVEDIDDAVDMLLKDCYNTNKLKNNIRVLLRAALAYWWLSDIQKEYITTGFLRKLKAHYFKNERRMKLVEELPCSLKNQNLIVQPDDMGRLVIAHTPNSNARKTQEKDALRTFLNNYASLDRTKRDVLWERLRNLVILFVLGSEYFPLSDSDKQQYVEEQAHSPFVEYIFDVDETGKEYPDISAIRKSIRKKSIARYHASLEYVSRNRAFFFEEEHLNAFWIHYIENEIERIYRKRRRGWRELYTNGYIIKKIEEAIRNYLCAKYIAIGKAVYHHAMQMVDADFDQETIVFGVVDEKYLNGISSLEYERIKAEERFQRTCAVYLTFACNYLANETVNLDEVNSDFLFLKRDLSDEERDDGKKTIAEVVKPDALRNILQFFGGLSSWEHFFDGVDELEFLDDIRSILCAFRNKAFHFSTKNNKQQWNGDRIGRMFEWECAKKMQRLDQLVFSCSAFYQASDVISCINRLYADEKIEQSDRIRFSEVVNRGNLDGVLSKIVSVQITSDREKYEEWSNLLYELLSRIFYRAFLIDERSVDLFRDCLKEKDDKDNAFIVHHLICILDERKNGGSVTPIYRYILSTANREKSPLSKMKNASVISKTILQESLRDAFLKFLENESELYGFIKSPLFCDIKPSLSRNMETYHLQRYDYLVEKVKNSSELQQWYIIGRLLPTHQISDFMKDIKRYAGYAIKVAQNAKLTGNDIGVLDSTIDDYKSILQVLDLCKTWNEQSTNCVLDYFESNDDYARYLMKYVSFEIADDETPTEALKRFCLQEVDGEPIGLYFDENGLILNRSIVLGKLYGTEGKDCITSLKMNYNTILDYKNVSHEKGKNNTLEDQKNINAKYNLLRKVRDLKIDTEVSEIFYELQGKLISWVYLRERDLMYFQLGFHYLCIHNDEHNPVGYDYIGNYKGTILYQIVAMYTNGMPLIGKDGKLGKPSKGNVETSMKLNKFFIPYTEGMTDSKEGVYVAGLELFEDVKQHEKYIKLRNNIVHFRYCVENTMSIFDVYNEMYHYFLSYDARYKSHVTEGIGWILEKHGIISSIKFQKSYNEEENNKMCYKMGLRSENGLFSADRSLFPIQDNKVIDSVKEYYIEYLRGITTMLYSPHPIPKKFWGEPREKTK